MLKTNHEHLIKISVQGEIAPPKMPALPAMPHLIDKEGRPVLVPMYGGLVYNVKIGDSAMGWVGDQINPGVSIRSGNGDVNRALTTLACVGNEAMIVSGSARGARGVVVGKSGRWAEHVICHFSDEVMANLVVGDKIQVRAMGTGLKIDGAPGVVPRSLCPTLLPKLGCRVAGGKLRVPVAATVPAELFGAGLGLPETWSLDIQTSDAALMQKHGLDKLRLGDVVALLDSDSSYNHGYRKGGISIGVVCQTDSVRAGFGPGVTILMTAPGGEIEPEISQSATLAQILQLQA